MSNVRDHSQVSCRWLVSVFVLAKISAASIRGAAAFLRACLDDLRGVAATCFMKQSKRSMCPWRFNVNVGYALVRCSTCCGVGSIDQSVEAASHNPDGPVRSFHCQHSELLHVEVGSGGGSQIALLSNRRPPQRWVGLLRNRLGVKGYRVHTCSVYCRQRCASIAHFALTSATAAISHAAC